MGSEAVSQIEGFREILRSLSIVRDESLFELGHSYITQADEAGDRRMAADLRLDMAGYYNNIRSESKTARTLCEEALPEIRTWNDPFLLADVHKRMGAYSYLLSEFPLAGNEFNTSRQLLESIEAPDDKTMSLLGAVYYNLSLVYRADTYTDYRIDLNNQAIDIYTRLGQMNNVARSYNLMGNILFDKDKLEEALPVYLKALKIYEAHIEIGDQGISYTYNNISSCYNKLGNYQESLQYLQKSIAIREQYGNPNEIAVSYMLLGSTYSQMAAYKEGEVYLSKAISIFTDTGNIYDLSHASHFMAELYECWGDFEKAYIHLTKHLSLQNELNKDAQRHAIAEALAESNIEQQEAEARLLRKKNAEIEEYSKKLQVSNEELNQFAHIVSHDLKEPLRMISTYTDMLRTMLPLDDQPAARQSMDFVIDGTDRMQGLINELLEYSKVGATTKLQPVDLNDILTLARMNLAGLLTDKSGVIEKNHLPTIDSDQTLMLQLFQNLLGNGLKYNKSTTPNVGVDYQIADQEIELHFYDNGMGIPEEYRQKAFEIFRRLPGTADIKGTGIGLAICSKIAARLNGRIWITSNEPSGTIFKVALPYINRGLTVV
jgi:signal transduction histidine kinase